MTTLLEADNYEADASYGDELSTYTASLTSSSYDFPSQNGRSYHAYKAGRYYLPNDSQEQDRLDVHYSMVRRIMNNKLNLAPIPPSINRAVDLGTGTGLWAINFADAFPNTEVLGIDLSPIQPSWTPPNLKFLIDDFEAEWEHEKDPFDYIHACLLIGSVKDWPRLFQQAFRCLKPGGYVEFQDWDVTLYSQDDTLPFDCPLNRWTRLVIESLAMMGSEPCPGLHLEKWMKDAGFVDGVVNRTPVPMGNWPKDRAQKELGVLNHIQTGEALEAVSLGTLMNRPEAEGRWTFEEVQAFLVDVRKDFNDERIHSLYDLYVLPGLLLVWMCCAWFGGTDFLCSYIVHGRKPE